MLKVAGKVFLFVFSLNVLSIVESRRGSRYYSVKESAICKGFGYGDNTIYDPETSQCYTSKSRGPCGENMIFFEDPGVKGFGYCDCEDRHEEYAQYHCDMRPLTFWPPENRCYPVYSQGPCRRGEWLVLQNSVAFCERHNCPVSTIEDKNFWFSQEGRCYRVGTLGYCRNGFLIYSLDKENPFCGGKLSRDDNLFLAQEAQRNPQVPYHEIEVKNEYYQTPCTKAHPIKFKCGFGSRLKFFSVQGKIGNHC